MTTRYAHLDDCQNCEHIRFQHDGYSNGKCMIRDCPCGGFVKK